MTAPRPIPARIRKLVPVLNSAVDGEVVATARAIGRVLHANGQTFHDLAAALPVHQPEPSLGDNRRHHRETPRPARWGDWRGAWRRDPKPRRYTPIQEARQEDQAAFCRRRLARLGERERTFITNISPQRHGLSLRQGDWLADITARLEMEDRQWWQ